MKPILGEEEIRFTLRIPLELIVDIDKDRKEKIGKISRNQWIIEAINHYIVTNANSKTRKL